MSNIISFHDKISLDSDFLAMSNGGTDMFLNILALSGAAIARTESEKRLMVYLSERDQITGRGCVGFSIVEMPWNKESFEADKDFLIQVIHGARNKIGWEMLDYRPSEDFVSYYLDTFENLISQMTIDDIRADALNHWLEESEADDPVHCNFPRCKKHLIFLTCFGCQICNSGVR